MNALRGTYEIPHDRICMHECVIAPGELLDLGVHTTDIAKALIDRGYHPPTIYFPLIVHEAMMIEPTETESRETVPMRSPRQESPLYATRNKHCFR